MSNLKGASWGKLRDSLNLTFTKDIVEKISPGVNECSEKFTSNLARRSKNSMNVELKDIFTRYAFDVMTSTIFGEETNSLVEPRSNFYQMRNQGTHFQNLWFSTKFYLCSICPKISQPLGITPCSLQVLQYLEKNLDRFGAKDVKNQNLITLLKQKSDLSNEEVANQAFMFSLVGYNTVSTACTFMAYELAVNPEVQSKLRAEIQENFDELENLSQRVRKMKYLNLVLNGNLYSIYFNIIYSDNLLLKIFCSTKIIIELFRNYYSIVRKLLFYYALIIILLYKNYFQRL